MRRIVFDHPGLDRVGEDAAKQAHGPARGSATAANDSLAAELFGFHGHACFAGDDVLHQVIHVRLGDVSYTSRSEKGNDVPADTADIGGDGGVLLRPAAFSSEERRVGNECVRTGRFWWAPFH